LDHGSVEIEVRRERPCRRSASNRRALSACKGGEPGSSIDQIHRSDRTADWPPLSTWPRSANRWQWRSTTWRALSAWRR